MQKLQIPRPDPDALLAKGIPALSYPAGHEQIKLPTIGLDNVDMNKGSFREENGWPRDHETWKKRWLHGDIKNMAFLYTYPVFKKIVDKGELK